MVNVTLNANLGKATACSRRTARRGQRGAAVFIVMMVLALLTAVGMFAVRSASLADVAAGYDREGAQAGLVAEYAITASAAYLANDPSTVINGYLASTDPTPQPCQSNALPGPYPQPKPRPGCYRLELAEVQTSFVKTSGETVFAARNLTDSATGSNSSLNASETTSAAWVVEVTDLTKTGASAVGDPAPLITMTLTAIAQVRPAAACDAATRRSPTAGQQVMRAIIATQSSLIP